MGEEGNGPRQVEVEPDAPWEGGAGGRCMGEEGNGRV